MKAMAEPPLTHDAIRVSVARTTAELAGLATPWRDLALSVPRPNIFLTPDWVQTWWGHYGDGGELRLLAAHQDDHLVGIAPLWVATAGRSRRREVRFLGAGQAAPEHLEFLVAPGSEDRVAASLAATIAAFDDIDLVRFDDLAAGSVTTRALELALGATGAAVSVRERSRCLYLRIDRTWDERLASMSSSARQRVRRLPRRLATRTGAVVEPCATGEEIDRALDLLVEWNPRRWEDRGATSAFSDPRFVAFHREFARRAERHGWLRMFVAQNETAACSVFYGMQIGPIASFYNSAFSPEFADLAPGQVVFDHAIEQAHHAGVTEYDLLRGDHEYKRRWTQEARTTVSLLASAPTIRGRSWKVEDRAKQSLRRARSLPARIRPRVRVDRWHLAIAASPRGQLVGDSSAAAARWISPADPTSYWADPFLVSDGNRQHVLCEQFDYRDPVGRVVALTVETDGSVVEHGEVLDVEGHASFPFVVEADGEVYCIPETAAAGEISLHRAVELPRRWERVATLVEFAGIDTTVVAHQGRWWMFTCAAEGRGTSELHVYHADSIEGPWVPHAANPVKVDERCARSAGAPWVDANGTLMRPAQDCGDRYGGRVVHCEVVTLTPDAFAERIVRVQEPPPGFEACHTLSYPSDGVVVFDAATTIPVWRHLSTLGFFLRSELRRVRRFISRTAASRRV